MALIRKRPAGSGAYSRTGRGLAAALAATMAVGGVSLIGAHSANAEPTQWAQEPTVQAAGNFLDVTIGGKPLDPILALAYARSDYDGTSTVTSDQNPLDVKILNAIDLPLTGVLQFPGLLGIKLGVVNQVAKAQPDGFSYGASGAVLNSGAVSIGGDNDAFPADATIDLSPSGIMGGSGSALDAIGHIRLSINGLSALAQTPTGFDKGATTDYRIADVKLDIGSPMLGQLLGPVVGGLMGVLGGVTGAAGVGTGPGACADLDPGALQLAGGTIAIDPHNFAVVISLNALLKALNLDLNNLPPNTDLIKYLLNYLSSTNGLIGGLVNIVTNLFGSCSNPLSTSMSKVPVLGDLLDALSNGMTTSTTSQLADITKRLASANGGPLGQLADVLKPLLAIGANVQPMGPKGSFETNFKENLPKQGMTPPAKPYTALVRALEIDVLGGALTIGLANAAAGPSLPGMEIDAATATASPSSEIAGVAVGPRAAEPPTAIPAGQGDGGMPVAPIVLLVVGLMMAGGGAIAWKLRGAHAL